MSTSSGVPLKKYRLVPTLIFALLLWSCAPMKRMTANRSQTETKTEQTTKTDIGKQKEIISATESQKQEAEETEVIIREYDTDKPTDSITGKPPLKKEILKTKRKQTNEKEQNQVKENEQTSLTAQVFVREKEKQNLRTDDKRQTDAPVWHFILLALGILILLFLFRNPIKKLIKKLS